MKNFEECIDFICKQITNQNKQQLSNEELDALVSFLESTLKNPIIRSMSIGNNIEDTSLTEDDKIKIQIKSQKGLSL